MAIWFTDPTRLATALGLVSAGLVFAFQQVVTAMAGYLVILRGKTFNVGDRITMGGVRGDLITLSFLQTTILEMGQPPAVQNANPAMWVRSRQYTCAARHTLPIADLGEQALTTLHQRYHLHRSDDAPTVYYRITDNWLELTVHFLVPDHGIRDMKDAMSRDILTEFDAVGIGIASATTAIVELPPLRWQREQGVRAMERSGEKQTNRHANNNETPLQRLEHREGGEPL